jgi:hypothetical protein
MAALISALDNITTTQFGEKGQTEYTWSSNVDDRLVQLNFQLVRNRDNDTELFEKIEELLFHLYKSYQMNAISKEVYVNYMSYMYRLIALTRDMIDGKGEYKLAYMMLGVWLKMAGLTGNDNFIELAKFAFKHFLVDDNGEHPYGSWKDLKGLYSFSVLHFDKCNWNPLINYAIEITNEVLTRDMHSETPSLLAKWIPREKSSCGELFTMLALDFYKNDNILKTATTEESKQRAIRKCLTLYRKIVSSINKKLDTVQIKQCARNWSNIDFNKVTSITMHKQKKAFMNKKHDDSIRYNKPDRIICSNNFSKYLENVKKGDIDAKGARVSMADFTKEALKLLDTMNPDIESIDLLNAQWANNSVTINGDSLGKMIAMVDTSGSMEGDPLMVAIALGIRIAEKSLLGKRVMTFSANPTWVNFDGCDDKFSEMVRRVKNANWGMNTNFASALKLILDAIERNKLHPNDVEDMVLVILSDMQIDQADNGTSKSMYAYIETLYKDVGMRVWGKPYKPPHILFWNLRSTNGFPSLSSQKNSSMMSGFSPSLLNMFCQEGMTSLQSCTPWTLFIKSLTNDRYNCLNEFIHEIL